MDAYFRSDKGIKTKLDIAESSNSQKSKKCRKYDEKYLDFGFTCTTIDNEERPQCVVCSKVLANDSMLPNKLRRHFETLHGNLKSKDRKYFIHKATELKQQQKSFSQNVFASSNSLLASYKVAYLVARCKKPHTIAEELILPAAIDMVSIMVNENAAKKLRSVPLSDSTVSRRISDLAIDIKEQLIQQLKDKEFAIQLDEATDSNSEAYLICYVRFISENNSFFEDLLFCESITLGTSANELFEIVNKFIEENQIEWTKCIGICTDGARSMSGHYNGLRALICKKAPEALWTHCIIHRESLASKNLSSDLNDVLSIAIAVVNYIKTRPRKARFFSKMCNDMGAEHTSLLYYSNSRWLSRGNVISRVFELRSELHSFLVEENHVYAENFIDSVFLTKMAYLSDIFQKLNTLNLSLQGTDTNILELSDKITAFRKKLLLWRRKIEDECVTDCFDVLSTFLKESNLQLTKNTKDVFIEHLTKLHTDFEKYFPKTEEYNWIRDPFSADPPTNFITAEEEQFIDLSSDNTLKIKFNSCSMPKFWASLKSEYPVISKKALRILLPFATSYLCETGFSAMAVIKSKYRSTVNLENEMRLAISKCMPRFNKLCNAKQAHPSH